MTQIQPDQTTDIFNMQVAEIEIGGVIWCVNGTGHLTHITHYVVTDYSFFGCQDPAGWHLWHIERSECKFEFLGADEADAGTWQKIINDYTPSAVVVRGNYDRNNVVRSCRLTLYAPQADGVALSNSMPGFGRLFLLELQQ